MFRGHDQCRGQAEYLRKVSPKALGAENFRRKKNTEMGQHLALRGIFPLSIFFSTPKVFEEFFVNTRPQYTGGGVVFPGKGIDFRQG